MKKSTETKIDILMNGFNASPTIETAQELIDTLVGALAVAENIRHNLSNARLVRSGNQQPLGRITISAGAAACRRDEDVLELIERADQALYLAKERGRNRVIAETEL